MYQRHTIVRIVQAGACAAAFLIVARPGAAVAAGPSACVVAWKTGMPLKEQGRLIEARRAMMGCTRNSCGALLRSECKREFHEISQAIASVVPEVTDQAGAPVTRVEVTMDGRVLTSRLDGRPLFVDPGSHEFSFKTDDGAVATQKVAVEQGQRNQRLSVSLAAGKKSDPLADLEAASPRTAAPERAKPEEIVSEEPATTPRARQAVSDDEPSRSRSRDSGSAGTSHTGAYLLGALGLVGVGGYGLMTYWGRRDNTELNNCTPNCPTANVDHVRKMYLAADISLGVGIAALAASTWLFISSGSSSKKETASKRSPYVLDLRPTPSGALASVSGAF
jgi:hypothetical protein